jgi:hypothetical protein
MFKLLLNSACSDKIDPQEHTLVIMQSVSKTRQPAVPSETHQVFKATKIQINCPPSHVAWFTCGLAVHRPGISWAP